MSNNSPFVPLLRYFNKKYFPFIYSKSAYYIEGYFFFYGPMDFYFLKQFCSSVEPISEDYLSSLKLSTSKKYYCNNLSFFEDYFYLRRYDVSLIDYPLL